MTANLITGALLKTALNDFGTGKTANREIEKMTREIVAFRPGDFYKEIIGSFRPRGIRPIFLITENNLFYDAR